MGLLLNHFDCILQRHRRDSKEEERIRDVTTSGGGVMTVKNVCTKREYRLARSGRAIGAGIPPSSLSETNKVCVIQHTFSLCPGVSLGRLPSACLLAPSPCPK